MSRDPNRTLPHVIVSGARYSCITAGITPPELTLQTTRPAQDTTHTSTTTLQTPEVCISNTKEAGTAAAAVPVSTGFAKSRIICYIRVPPRLMEIGGGGEGGGGLDSGVGPNLSGGFFQ